MVLISKPDLTKKEALQTDLVGASLLLRGVSPKILALGSSNIINFDDVRYLIPQAVSHI